MRLLVVWELPSGPADDVRAAHRNHRSVAQAALLVLVRVRVLVVCAVGSESTIAPFLMRRAMIK